VGDKKKVLVTGLSGRIGSVVRKLLGDKYELSGLDLVALDDVPCVVADIADLDAIAPAFEGIDTVLHLGASPHPRDPWDAILKNNIIGTRNVYEASRLAGVKRVIFASSNHTVGMYPLKEDPYKAIYEGRLEEIRQPITKLTPDLIRPDSYYGVSKCFGESLGSFFHDEYGISIICLRISWLMKTDEPTFSPPSLSMWLSHRDGAQLLEKSIDAPPSVGFAIVNGESNNTLGLRDLTSAKEILGFEPQDNAGSEWTPVPGSPSVM
jgi:nucleoside-diphosphate-sugar epimerase